MCYASVLLKGMGDSTIKSQLSSILGGKAVILTCLNCQHYKSQNLTFICGVGIHPPGSLVNNFRVMISTQSSQFLTSKYIDGEDLQTFSTISTEELCTVSHKASMISG